MIRPAKQHQPERPAGHRELLAALQAIGQQLCRQTEALEQVAHFAESLERRLAILERQLQILHPLPPSNDDEETV